MRLLPRQLPHFRPLDKIDFESHSSPTVYAAINRLPPPSSSQVFEASVPRLPIRIGFLLNTFSYGGSETETLELVRGADPNILKFTGIAVATPLPLPAEEPPVDGSFPPIYACSSANIDPHDLRVRTVDDFKAAVRYIVSQSDVLITWGLSDIQHYLPAGRLPRVIIHSKDSGTWAEGFAAPNSLLTRYYVGNSSMAASAFPKPLRDKVTIIHDGINPNRIAQRISRKEQRSIWNLSCLDKIVGYVGRIEYDKGLTKLVDGVAALPADWKAVLIGVNPNSRFAEQLSFHCENSIPDRYRLLPWCHDVGSALGAFDVFCHPSEHEGFSNSIAEAWLAGIPTIYTRDTGAVTDLGEMGIGVSQQASGKEIAKAILSAHQNLEMIARAQSVIKSKYLVEHNVARWTDYLLRVCHEPRRPRVIVVVPRELRKEAELVVSALARADIDPCCLAVANGEQPSLTSNIYEHPHCPEFGISTPADLAVLAQYCRPDVVLATSTFESYASKSKLNGIPVLIGNFDHFLGTSTCVQWIRYLSSRNGVFS